MSRSDSQAPLGEAGAPEGGVPPTPFVETRLGGLFFVNALLAGPGLLLLVPLVLGALARGLGLVEGPSEFFDTIPLVAAHVAPWAGWLALVPLGTTVWNLTMSPRGWVRAALILFLALHLGVLAYTVFRWVG